MNAVSHAYRVIGWQENLTEDECPPVWMWPFEDELEVWFEEVDRKRKDKWGGGASNDDDDEAGGSMMANDFARGRK